MGLSPSKTAITQVRSAAMVVMPAVCVDIILLLMGQPSLTTAIITTTTIQEMPLAKILVYLEMSRARPRRSSRAARYAIYSTAVRQLVILLRGIRTSQLRVVIFILS